VQETVEAHADIVDHGAGLTAWFMRRHRARHAAWRETGSAKSLRHNQEDDALIVESRELVATAGGT